MIWGRQFVLWFCTHIKLECVTVLRNCCFKFVYSLLQRTIEHGMLAFCQAHAAAPVAAPLRKRKEKTADSDGKKGKKTKSCAKDRLLSSTYPAIPQGDFPVLLGVSTCGVVLPGHDRGRAACHFALCLELR